MKHMRIIALLFVFCLSAAGCIDHNRICDDLLTDDQFIPDATSIANAYRYDLEQLCENSPFRSIDQRELNYLYSKHCLDVCEDEFRMFSVTLHSLSVFEEELCDVDDKDDKEWHREFTYPIFDESVEELLHQSESLNECIEVHLR